MASEEEEAAETTAADSVLEEKNPTTWTVFGIQVPKHYELHLKASAIVAIAIFLAAPVRVATLVLHTVWTSLGVATGVGLGFGLAMHVYEQLQYMHKSNVAYKQSTTTTATPPMPSSLRRIGGDSARTRSVSGGGINGSAATTTNQSRAPTMVLEDGTSYFSLMALAGYPVQDRVLRGQILKQDASFWEILYRFTDVPISQQRGPQLLQADWPGLPPPVTRELGRFVEHLMRDFVSGWYSRLDGGCVFRDEKEKRLAGILRDGKKVTITDSGDDTNNNTTTNTDEASHPGRKMVFSTLTHRRMPMIDQTYRVLSAAFGNLATRAEHINVFSLALLKWTQVLAHTFKVYRQLRRAAESRNQTDKPKEIEVTREFLLAGKLHKAVTFGLDVPSLLFADAQGTECGTGTDQPPRDATQVLEQRLFHTQIIQECELDYNRVVASRLVKALLPRTDSSSQVVMALVVEIISSCVLQPVMNLWVPSYLNELVLKSMTKQEVLEESKMENVQEQAESLPEETTEPERKTSNASDLEGATASTLSERTSIPDFESTERDRTSSEVDLGGFPADASVAQSSEINGRNRADTDQAGDDESNARSKPTPGDILLVLTSLALTELERYVNFESCRQARLNNRVDDVNYDDPACQGAVLRLVMIVEAAVLQGRCAFRHPVQNSEENDGEDTEQHTREESLCQLLMEMTSDMKAFESRIDSMSQESEGSFILQEVAAVSPFEPEPYEISTLRTLISTWMHTGQLSRAVSLLVKGAKNIFRPYYTDESFLFVERTAAAFQKQIEVLEGVDIMAETMAVLASPRIDIEAEATTAVMEEIEGSISEGDTNSRQFSALSHLSDEIHASATTDMMAHNFGNTSTPRFLDFHKNSAFAASLRSERERRQRSWETQKADENVYIIHRPGAPQAEVDLHNELHGLARTFYNGTNIVSIRDAARKSEQGGESDSISPDMGKVSLITVETVSSRRRIEVPDDDSSFLLRAQPRPLNPVSVHRDDRNHDLSYKCFLATYEEPACSPGPNRYLVGRFIRRCFLQYYPIDRTATIMLHNDARKVDRRKGKPARQQVQQNQPPPYLSGSFLRERHLCQKWTQKGSSAAQTFLSSSVMEATDFNATPRSGKALDFIYRMSLFERPIVDLAGKRFTVHDSSSKGHHRSDASSLEISDGSLSALLLSIGREYGKEDGDSTGSDKGEYRQMIEMGPDGYPIIFMKFNRSSGDETSTEIKPYRLSFVRAALLVTSARFEAQQQCLTECVKSGSAKSATKARIEAQLKPTLKILEFANDRGNDGVRASTLLRDLKLGVYHIDREQLRRNGLLNPRNPTSILNLTAKVEMAVQAKDVPELGGSYSVPPTTTLYKIRCVATIELVGSEDDAGDLEQYLLDDGTLGSTYTEEWVVYRSMKDFQIFHKHLKSQVANAEFPASTGSRLVGAATAAFSSGNHGKRNRRALIPSLAQASKTGAISSTKRAILKRGELLGGYLEYLLTPGHIINRCMELLYFLGASYPFPPEIYVAKAPVRLVDPLGRTSFVRNVATRFDPDNDLRREMDATERRRLDSETSKTGDDFADKNSIDIERPTTGDNLDDSDLNISILNKVDQVPLSEVRNRLVELVKFQFGFENASFFRSRILSALETASFVAITKGSEFRKLLYKIHVQQLNPEAVAKLIESVLDVLWPDGCWLSPRVPLTEQEEEDLREGSRQKLHESFPEQIRTILGRELTKDGLDMVHEMLQNRVVVKSLFYMLFDLLWIEVFPELRDALPCASALDID